ncbi:SusC/RagA family TonB-linked outer membrane protein [Pedobacter nyackensis]|uniref:TonB-linked outer membrane protein, SusC/RagA family n=1 Tax=Pedobacter nyackensis TaxID=475255 RepID=A0A1W2DW12_9SPHI|nr:SusC/RagA family TonB-linked outer membrane protein [Pedobacter nyackensis]SMD01262.1 TonB-linked outer membrane protein, SusC/RagA family [Pedobacter nyackensis]
MIKLTTLIITVFLFQLSSSTKAQISIHVKQESLRKVLEKISKQSGYDLIYSVQDFKGVKRVSLNLNNTSLERALEISFAGQPLTYELSDKTLMIRRKDEKYLFKQVTKHFKQQKITGKVTDQSGLPLSGVNVMVKGSRLRAVTDRDGYYSIKTTENEALVYTFVGYTKQTQIIGKRATIDIKLTESVGKLEQVDVVVNTGYQALSMEHSTGSFYQIDSETINRRVSTNILDRLDGMASGVFFNGMETSPINSNPASQRELGINIRGQSTIQGSVDPLIVINNFPYEGLLQNINPNDVESVTILKDASAASIWGARSANGVIVITTKTAKKNKPLKIDITTNINVINKPDILGNKAYIGAKDFIEIEKTLFNNGFFDADISNTSAMTALSPVVEALANHKSGILTNSQLESIISSLGNQDIRQDYDRYVHQKAVKQQYHISLTKGTDKGSYFFSIGGDKNTENTINKRFDRITVNSNNSYNLTPKLKLNTQVSYSNNTTDNYNLGYMYNGMMGVNSSYGRILPYARLVDHQGTPLAIDRILRATYIEELEKKGFYDWHLRPLDEIRMANQQSKVNNFLIRTSLKYTIKPFLHAEGFFQNENQSIYGRNHQSINTYYVRNLINQFAQYNENEGKVNFIFPEGGVLNLDNLRTKTQNYRGQLSYNQTVGNHRINAILGAEISETKATGDSQVSYGYNDQLGSSDMQLDYTLDYPVNPSGSKHIPAPARSVSGHMQRFLSYYFNCGYTFKNRYNLSFSVRKDGSNFFGTSANKRFTPLWSTGIGWIVSNDLKIRMSYGFNGNIGNIASQLTGMYFKTPSDPDLVLTNLTAPNTKLSWERVKNVNFGLDFGTKNNRIRATIEYYIKNGIDLLQPSPLAPQTGFLTFTNNSATVKSRGFDVNITSRNMIKAIQWNTSLIYGFITDKVKKYNPKPTANSFRDRPMVLEKPMYSVYSYRWAGLDTENGDPLGYFNGQISKDYEGIINNFNPDSLVYHGNGRPSHFGTVRNNFSYRGISLSINIAFSLGYYFRRTSTSLNYQDIIYMDQHEDFKKRWQKQGDEAITNIPSVIYPTNTTRNTFYKYSEMLVLKGDHIRLQDIRISYSFSEKICSKLKIKTLSVYTFMNNLGIIWRANKQNLDPQTEQGGMSILFRNPFSIATGVNIGF